jgi:hypothetical protein
MTTALIVYFNNPSPQVNDTYFSPYYDYLMHNFGLWGEEVQMLYLIDSAWNIGHVVNQNITVHVADPKRSQFQIYKHLLSTIDAQVVCFMEPTFFLTRVGVIQKVLEAFRFHDIVTMSKTAITPAFFAAKRELLLEYSKLDWDATDTQTALTTVNREMKKNKVDFYTIDYEDVQYLYDKNHTDLTQPYGYYYLKHGFQPAQLLTDRYFINTQLYTDSLVQPFEQLIFRFAWYWVLCEQTDNLIPRHKQIEKILLDLHVKLPTWERYIKGFKMFYNLA